MKNKVSLIVLFSVIGLQTSYALSCHNEHSYQARHREDFLIPRNYDDFLRDRINELFAYNVQPLMTQLEIDEIKATAVHNTMRAYRSIIIALDGSINKINLCPNQLLSKHLAKAIAKKAGKIYKKWLRDLSHSPNILWNQPVYSIETVRNHIYDEVYQLVELGEPGCLSLFAGKNLDAYVHQFQHIYK